ncbi:MAG: M16 family metallopeptidase [Paenibacillus sp.]|uniref:M16 family metallopeptidase n=1 Tax=Paenibacillus sp. TaxID=58172 RepID=UPI003B7F8E28
MQSFTTERRNNLSVHMLPTQQYANHYVQINLINTQQTIPSAIFVMIVRLLMNSCRRFPSNRLLQQQLWSLYGAELTCRFDYKGDTQIASITMRIPHITDDKLITGTQIEAIHSALQLLAGLLYDPAVDDHGMFEEMQVQEEMAWTEHHIAHDGTDWDKVVQSRCLEWMGYEGQNRQFALEELQHSVGSYELYQHYQTLIHNPIHIHVLGDIHPGRIKDLIWEQFGCVNTPYPREEEVEERQGDPGEQREAGAMMMELLEIHQCKINVTYRTGIRYGSAWYPALFVFHTLFGATPASRLQVGLRERSPLVYQVTTTLDDFRETLHITTGTSSANVTDVLEGIDTEWKRICDGDVSERELYTAVQNVMHYVQVGFDLPHQVITNHMDQMLSGSQMTTAQFLEEIARVTPEEVAFVATRLRKEVTWILYPESEYSA